MSTLYYANLVYVLLKGEDQRFCRIFYQFSSKSLEHECNILLPFFTNPFSAFSSCAYSGLHNNRRLLLSRSFRGKFLEKSLSMQILHFFQILCIFVTMAQCSLTWSV